MCMQIGREVYTVHVASLPKLLNRGVKEREVEGIKEKEKSERGVKFVHVGALSPCQLLSSESLMDFQESGSTS